MIGLLQRVSDAKVAVDGAVIAKIGLGLVVLIGVEAGDGKPQAERLLERLLGYRVFPDAGGKMNLSLRDTGGGASEPGAGAPVSGDVTAEARMSPWL